MWRGRSVVDDDPDGECSRQLLPVGSLLLYGTSYINQLYWNALMASLPDDAQRVALAQHGASRLSEDGASLSDGSEREQGLLQTCLYRVRALAVRCARCVRAPCRAFWSS